MHKKLNEMLRKAEEYTYGILMTRKEIQEHEVKKDKQIRGRITTIRSASRGRGGESRNDSKRRENT
jgi:hypothetical protein